MSDLTGKVFMVTGGESGIGQAIALRAARDGAKWLSQDLSLIHI